MSNNILPLPETIDTLNVNAWWVLSEEKRDEIIKELKNINTIDEAKDIINKANNKSLYDFFLLCLRFPDDLWEGMGLFAYDNSKIKYELHDVISALSSSQKNV